MSLHGDAAAAVPVTWRYSVPYPDRRACAFETRVDDAVAIWFGPLRRLWPAPEHILLFVCRERGMEVTLDVGMGGAVVLGAVGLYSLVFWVPRWLESLAPVPRVVLDESLALAPSPSKKFDLKAHEAQGPPGSVDPGVVKCWDPCTLTDLGVQPACSMSVTPASRM